MKAEKGLVRPKQHNTYSYQLSSVVT